MNAPILDLMDPAICPAPDASARIRAAADARFLLSLARRARIDGLPKAEFRAANAKAAARKVIDHARRSSALSRCHGAVDLLPVEMMLAVSQPELRISV